MDLSPIKWDIDKFRDESFGHLQGELTILTDMKKVWISRKFISIYEARPSTYLVFCADTILKIFGLQLATDNIKGCDLFSTHEPWEIWEFYKRESKDDDDLFFFTASKKKFSKSKQICRRIGSGSWKGENATKEIQTNDDMIIDDGSGTKTKNATNSSLGEDTPSNGNREDFENDELNDDEFYKELFLEEEEEVQLSSRMTIHDGSATKSEIGTNSIVNEDPPSNRSEEDFVRVWKKGKSGKTRNKDARNASIVL
ncbi:uncharacterized protein LOC116126114 [Pistacia vera]|uniref:uncharacterized protein LOC116126114 n=1 Tax=Pistacia vera TaxID=55513 RepID=UPI001263D1FC|nr:uncharacterized protein LOC116126114 [Pistacia vera]